MRHLLTKSRFDKPLTAANAGDDKDAAMMAKLGLVPMDAEGPLRMRAVLCHQISE